jgi:hypothetical protein
VRANIVADNILERITTVIQENPHSGQSLLLFALCKTLDMPKGGHMYMLKKLQEMTPEIRLLAYDVMEYMANGKNQNNPDWTTYIEKMEIYIKG